MKTQHFQWWTLKLYGITIIVEKMQEILLLFFCLSFLHCTQTAQDLLNSQVYSRWMTFYLIPECFKEEKRHKGPILLFSVLKGQCHHSTNKHMFTVIIYQIQWHAVLILRTPILRYLSLRSVLPPLSNGGKWNFICDALKNTEQNENNMSQRQIIIY